MSDDLIARAKASSEGFVVPETWGEVVELEEGGGVFVGRYRGQEDGRARRARLPVLGRGRRAALLPARVPAEAGDGAREAVARRHRLRLPRRELRDAVRRPGEATGIAYGVAVEPNDAPLPERRPATATTTTSRSDDGSRVREDDHRSDEELAEAGRARRGTASRSPGRTASPVRRRKPAPAPAPPPGRTRRSLDDEEFAAGLFVERCRTPQPGRRRQPLGPRAARGRRAARAPRAVRDRAAARRSPCARRAAGTSTSAAAGQAAAEGPGRRERRRSCPRTATSSARRRCTRPGHVYGFRDDAWTP